MDAENGEQWNLSGKQENRKKRKDKFSALYNMKKKSYDLGENQWEKIATFWKKKNVLLQNRPVVTKTLLTFEQNYFWRTLRRYVTETNGIAGV